MLVIPSINATNFKDLKALIKKVQTFGTNWVHLDVTDGKFTLVKLWNNPRELKVISSKLKIRLEVHLMVNNPDEVLGSWLSAGVKKAIVHVESAKDISAMAGECLASGAELALAVNPETPITRLLKYKDWLKQALILAVAPGPAGQKFGMDQLKKIKSLRQKMPNVKIEVDGGVNLETGKLCKKAGADILVSAKYIFSGKNPKAAYQQLKKI